MRVVRLLVYDMDKKALEKQLGRSLPDGTRGLPYGTIRVTTLPSRWRLWRLFRALVE